MPDPTRPAADAQHAQARLSRQGLVIGGKTFPLLAGSVHYWRHSPDLWQPALEAVKRLGLQFVDTYVPWAVHEISPGEFDFGRKNSRLDVAAFVDLAATLDLYVILRPGPHINAELTLFGLPERVIWNPENQARSARGKPVVLPAPPLAFPVPSYASRAFLAEVERWFRALGEAVSSRCYPHGPIALVQVDNEGALYFRDGVYDQDYHPDALNAFRKLLQAKYQTVAQLRQVYGMPALRFETVEPPQRFDACNVLELTRHLDWAEYQEHLLADSLREMSEQLRRAGFLVPTSHNLPISEGATPLDPALISRAVDLVGIDYYHGTSPPQRAEIARRTSALAARSDFSDTPSFACELGAGCPAFLPPLHESDNRFTALTALAYGLRGYNLYMAVDRDRWIGAPFDQYGRRRASAEFWERLSAALERVRWHELRRSASVHILVPRSFRRLTRVLHAFGPVSSALLHIAGSSAADTCFEEGFGDDDLVVGTEQFLRELEQALEAERIPYAIYGADLFEYASQQARWIVGVCPGLLESTFATALAAGSEPPRSIGPRAPERDEFLRTVQLPVPAAHGDLPGLIGPGRDEVVAAVRAAVRQLKLPALHATPAEVFVTMHEDEHGNPRVLFVINPSGRDVSASVGALDCCLAVDVMDGEHIRAKKGQFELEVRAGTARMLELRTA